MRAAGMTLRAIADALNAEGVRTARGGTTWRASTVNVSGLATNAHDATQGTGSRCRRPRSVSWFVVENYDNPAGRLHALLTKYAEQSGTAQRDHAWAETLGCDAADIELRIGVVFDLFGSTRVAAEQAPANYARIPHHVAAIQSAVFPRAVPWKSPASDAKVPGTPLELLGMFSNYLHISRPDGIVPDDDARAELRQSVLDLFDAVAEDDELPTQVRHAFRSRLNDMLRALDHLEEGGPEHVRLAAEALLFASFTPQASPGLKTKFATIATTVILAFGVVDKGADTVTSLATAANAVGELSAAQTQKALPAGPTALPSAPTNEPDADTEEPAGDSALAE